MGEAPAETPSTPNSTPSRHVARKLEPGRLLSARVSVLLIDAMRLSRDCVGQALSTAAHDFDVVELMGSSEIAREDHPAVVVFNLHATPLSDTWASESIAEIRQRTEAPILVISSVGDEPSALRAVSGGLRGYVPASVDIGMLVAAIRLVLAGGTFVPHEIVAQYAHKCSESAESGDSDVTFLGFTPREAEVLGKIRQGKINKIIAYELNISESTVKIHVRHIMRKLNATTRTQVAYLVQNRVPAR
jgi:DNA-binding NarL/FixJ family response regulator